MVNKSQSCLGVDFSFLYPCQAADNCLKLQLWEICCLWSQVPAFMGIYCPTFATNRCNFKHLKFKKCCDPYPQLQHLGSWGRKKFESIAGYTGRLIGKLKTKTKELVQFIRFCIKGADIYTWLSVGVFWTMLWWAFQGSLSHPWVLKVKTDHCNKWTADWVSSGNCCIEYPKAGGVSSKLLVTLAWYLLGELK